MATRRDLETRINQKITSLSRNDGQQQTCNKGKDGEASGNKRGILVSNKQTTEKH